MVWGISSVDGGSDVGTSAFVSVNTVSFRYTIPINLICNNYY